MNTTPILIEEGYWMNSQLSVARFFGGMKINGEQYIIVPPKNDMIQSKWAKVYRKLGREKFIEVIKKKISLEEAKRMTSKPVDNVEQLKLDL